jgi:ATP-dependent protease ClpP protease subunit
VGKELRKRGRARNNKRKLRIMTAVALTAMFIMTLGNVAGAEAAVLTTEVNGVMEEKTIAPARKVLETATPGDSVYIIVDSPGGEYWTAKELLNAMKTSKAANITIEVNGNAGSAAAFILLGADKVIATKEDRIMFHTPYWEIRGKVFRTPLSNMEAMGWSKAKFCLDKVLRKDGWFAFSKGTDVVIDGDVFVALNANFNCGKRNG